MGVLHPDLVPAELPSPHDVLRYAMGGSNATVDAPLPAATLNPLLVLASYYGYSEVVSSLLRQGADPNAVNVHVRRTMIA